MKEQMSSSVWNRDLLDNRTGRFLLRFVGPVFVLLAGVFLILGGTDSVFHSFGRDPFLAIFGSLVAAFGVLMLVCHTTRTTTPKGKERQKMIAAVLRYPIFGLLAVLFCYIVFRIFRQVFGV